MLTEIRDRSSGWFAWIIAALIIIPMAFWGVQEYASTEARPVVAEVGGQKIYQDSLRSQVARQQQQAVQANPSLANSDIFQSDFYKKGVLNNLISRALIEHVASEQNYQVGDEQLAKRIKEDPVFQTEGKFDPVLYQNYLNSQGLFSKTQFENQARENARIGQVTTGYQESALVLPDEIRAILEIQSEQRSFDLITVNQADFTDKVEVSDADIAEAYQANQADYMESDRRSVDYIELDKAMLAESIEVSDAEVEAAHRDYEETFSAAETRSTRHILLSTTGDKKAGEQLEKATELVGQLRAGADFAELAKELSDDSGSGVNGGSLGDVERGQMVAPFEKATFELEVGAISDPVKSQFGYHIIQVEKINKTEARSLAEMRFELTEDIKASKAEDEVLAKAEELRNIIFEQPDSLEGGANAISSEVKSTPLFSRDTGTGIASNDAVRAAAFGEQVAIENLNSELLDLGNGLYVAVRHKEFVPSQPKPLESVSAIVKSKLVAERASKAAEESGSSLKERAELNWSDLVSDESVEIASHTVSMIDTERKVAPDVLAQVTKIQLRDVATKVISFTGANGDFNIVRLNKIEPGDLSKVSQQVKDSTRRMLEQRNGQGLFAAYLKGLEQEVKPNINEDLL